MIPWSVTVHQQRVDGVERDVCETGADGAGLPEAFRSGWGAYVGALVVGLPLYICALSSTPLAAALLVAGFSPGATLVFLMVGPATNLATLVVVSKVLRGWAVARYLASIVVVPCSANDSRCTRVFCVRTSKLASRTAFMAPTAMSSL